VALHVPEAERFFVTDRGAVDEPVDYLERDVAADGEGPMAEDLNLVPCPGCDGVGYDGPGPVTPDTWLCPSCGGEGCISEREWEEYCLRHYPPLRSGPSTRGANSYPPRRLFPVK